MNGIRPKIPRLQLDPISYKNLRQEVLRRDGWRCQSCGTISNLEVHHRELRSGDDSEKTLITLCRACHARLHRCPSEELLMSASLAIIDVRDTCESQFRDRRRTVILPACACGLLVLAKTHGSGH